MESRYWSSSVFVLRTRPASGTALVAGGGRSAARSNPLNTQEPARRANARVGMRGNGIVGPHSRAVRVMWFGSFGFMIDAGDAAEVEPAWQRVESASRLSVVMSS